MAKKKQAGVLEALMNLSDEDFNKVVQFILDLVPPKKRGRPKKQQIVKPAEVPIVYVDQPKRRVKQVDQQTTTTKATVINKTSKVKGSGENLFLKSSDFNKFKEDTIIDQKLRGNNELEQRGVRIATVSAKCSICGKQESVSPKVVQTVDGEVLYTCNNCSLKAKRAK